ncbi:hypothetical protein ONA91_13150 [Micromonospora sp. DR5-3]|uniref:LppU/SCO3897 family protein n=1 Tax=unclassified Micromonospora TaxID=2617518 RepID=UPI0011DA98CD|nr:MULTISPECIES: hypothetical protein [unclassified Micromonospora]MCW3815403.1 hypothetical protein [Micromonospora sp. DR5-3]TYC22856.1 hypothetical protein FXF52_18870 [Micromonospora sp. MP36]
MPEQATPSSTRPATDGAPPPEPVAAPSRLGAVLGVVVLLLGVATALLVGLLIKVGPGGDLRDVLGGEDGTAEARIGDCVAELPTVAGVEAKAADDARVVRCDSPAAAYAVTGRVQDPAAARSRSAAGCEPYFRPGDDGYVLYRVGDDGDGYLLCLVHRANGR